VTATPTGTAAAGLPRRGQLAGDAAPIPGAPLGLRNTTGEAEPPAFTADLATCAFKAT